MTKEFSSEDALIRAAQSLKKLGTLADPVERKRQVEMKNAKIIGTQLMCRQHVLDPTALVIHQFMNHKAAPGQLAARLHLLSTKYPEAWITVHAHSPQGICLLTGSCVWYNPTEINAGQEDILPLSGSSNAALFPETKPIAFSLDF